MLFQGEVVGLRSIPAKFLLEPDKLFTTMEISIWQEGSVPESTFFIPGSLPLGTKLELEIREVKNG